MKKAGIAKVVTLKNGHLQTADEVVAHCAGHLASFKVPKRVIFVDSLPKNPSGKLLKRELRDHHADLFAAEPTGG